MQFVRVSAAALAWAALSSSTSLAAPLEARQTPSTCTSYASGYLILRPLSNTHNGTITYAGIEAGVKHAGLDGKQDSIVVTQDQNGNPLSPQVWEFWRCTDQDGQSPPPGYVTPSGGPTNNYFGILRPQSATQHCLALESTRSAQGARNSILDSSCTQVPQNERTFMYVDAIYSGSDVASNLFFADQQEALTIGNTAHKELQFIAGTSAGAYQLQLLPNTTP